MNQFVGIGRLTRDPQLRYTTNGTPVGGFTIAVDRDYKNQQGERETDFIDVVVWRGLAENVANYLGKGRLVAVKGRLQIRTYESNDGTKRKVAEIVAESVEFLDRPKNGAKGSENQAGASAQAPAQATAEPSQEEMDEVPF